jgi:uncharacterized protein GlcG (DUF336 family)
MKNFTLSKQLILCGVLLTPVTMALAAEPTDICPDASSKTAIQVALTALLKDAQAKQNGGFGFHMWAAVVNRAGQVCAIARSGADSGAQWPASRAIAAQKANTANGLSLPGFALSTANLHQPTQNGGSLYGLQFSNPVDTTVAYAGNASDYGTPNDAMVGKKIGGINVFGGGLALYASNGEIVGAVGVSGDSSCADHNIAWRMRNAAQLDFVPDGPSPAKNDQMIYTGETGTGLAGWEHPDCGHGEKAVTSSLPPTRKK